MGNRLSHFHSYRGAYSMLCESLCIHLLWYLTFILLYSRLALGVCDVWHQVPPKALKQPTIPRKSEPLGEFCMNLA